MLSDMSFLSMVASGARFVGGLGLGPILIVAGLVSATATAFSGEWAGLVLGLLVVLLGIDLLLFHGPRGLEPRRAERE